MVGVGTQWGRPITLMVSRESQVMSMNSIGACFVNLPGFSFPGYKGAHLGWARVGMLCYDKFRAHTQERGGLGLGLANLAITPWPKYAKNSCFLVILVPCSFKQKNGGSTECLNALN